MRYPFAFAALLAAAPATADEMTVLSYNIWWGGETNGATLEQTAEVIRQSGATVVGLQEKNVWDERGPAFRENNAFRLAEMLGWDVVDQQPEIAGAFASTAILSQHPITGVSDSGLCATIDADGTEVTVCNVHLASAPYQPYQLLDIPYGDGRFIDTEDEAIEEANLARGLAVETLVAEVAGTEGVVVVTGDFNEPSHLDWTPATIEAGMHPVAVAWPQSQRMADAGFTDAFRALRADPVAAPGYTWTPTTAEDDPADHHDRIDFVYVRGAQVIDVTVVGEGTERADVVVDPFPSDHRAVAATIDY